MGFELGFKVLNFAVRPVEIRVMFATLTYYNVSTVCKPNVSGVAGKSTTRLLTCRVLYTVIVGLTSKTLKP